MNEIGTYGIVRAAPAPEDDISALLEQLAVNGFAVREQILTRGEVASLNDRLEAVYRRQCDEVGGEGALAKIEDADIVRCALAYDDAFLELAQHPAIIEVATRFIGPTLVLMMQNGVINRPQRRQAQARWHRDLNYQHWVATAPLALSALVCLEDFNENTGGTLVLPASHKIEGFPSDRFVQENEVTVEAASGSVILMDAMVFHRSGINRSNRVRRGVNHVIGVPILSQPVDIPRMLGREAPQDPWLAGYLGYRWNPVRDVREWRLRKIAEAMGAGDEGRLASRTQIEDSGRDASAR
ncbi:MAG: phytanoyl-CoA dioxygenase family protein [Alphaproteobacteria bacterium]|nr:phytanoyl-CoA dioxygenase family protein [Alphaproteobacteria bacterium]